VDVSIAGTNTGQIGDEVKPVLCRPPGFRRQISRARGPRQCTYTRDSMYQGRPWTMRQYAPELRDGQRKLTGAEVPHQAGPDRPLPSPSTSPHQMGRDSDHPLAGRSWQVGVAMSSTTNCMAALRRHLRTSRPR